jgi:hypothetical protein
MTRLLRSLLILGLLASLPASAQQGITTCSSTSLAVSGTSSNVKLSACGETALLWNTGTQELFYAVGTAVGTAATVPSTGVLSTTSNSLPGNSFVVINTGTAPLYLAAITSTSTTTMRITQGLTK